jgi:homopolymeric O-antigen transport system ATP-binding protein
VTSVVVDNLTIDFPIYGAAHRSLRHTLLARTGGLVKRDEVHRRVVVRALDEVSLRLDVGDRLGLVGHNGAGKSTFLKALAGVYRPDVGSIRVEGRVSALLTSAPGLDVEDTGYENIKTCGLLLGMTAQEIEAKVEDIADFTELGEFLDLPVRTYSAGMVTRLSFAISTAIDPDILLLDEGLATGDARFAARAENRLERLIQRTRILVFASHSEELIRAMCNRLALMKQGRIVAVGTIDDIMDRFRQEESAPG